MKKNLAGPIMAGPNFWLGQSMTQPLAQPKWPSNNTCPAKLAQQKYGPATWPSQNWASSQTLAQPKSGKNWPSQKSGPAIMWKKLAQPKFGKNFGCWPSFGLFPNTNLIGQIALHSKNYKLSKAIFRVKFGQMLIILMYN